MVFHLSVKESNSLKSSRMEVGAEAFKETHQPGSLTLKRPRNYPAEADHFKLEGFSI